MPFDLDKLFEFCKAEIEAFSKDHQSEIFYGFAIDASLLCLNSVEHFASALHEYQAGWEVKARPIEKWEDLTDDDLEDADYMLGLEERFNKLDRNDKDACLAVINKRRLRFREEGNPYKTQEGIEELRENPGDWQYQGFAAMSDSVGFDEAAYATHYDMTDEDQMNSEYGLVMDELVEKLKQSNAFDCLKQTDDFFVVRVEHDY